MAETVAPKTTVNVDDDALADALAKRLSIERVRLATRQVQPEALQTVAEKLARKHVALPLAVDGKELVVAMANPRDIAAIQDFEFASSLKIRTVVAARSEIIDAIGQYYAPDDRVRQFTDHVAETPDFRVLRYGGEGDDGADEQSDTQPGTMSNVETAPVVKVCNSMLYDAIKAGASDIHVEPGLNEVVIRIRVDGALRRYTHFPRWLHQPVVSRLKILARLDIAERRVPQDGRLKVVYHGRDMDVRLSTLPTHHGEKAVMRVLGGGNIPTLAQLGIAAEELARIESVLARAQGMVFVTGPTGSGKTTTLYSMLTRMRSDERNLVTIEDPIEFQLEGINQVPVNPKAGVTFSNSLRSILRQDPDVILVGEIRDLDTAEITIRASMTGHFVLSTLHTNSAVATIGRLLDLGVDPALIATSLSLVVAQRLVRRVCRECVEPYTPDANALATFQLPPDGSYVRGKGCRACGNSGFAGRLGLYEALPMSRRIRELVHRRASEAELRDMAIGEGMRALPDLAAAAVRAGQTTPEEIARVIEPPLPQGSAVPVAVVPAAAQPPAAANKAPRILVVDDDPLMRRAVAGALGQLTDLQPAVEMASDGTEALDAVARTVPDLIVLDVMMPNVDGLEVCERLRSDVRSAFVPVLMLTRNNDEVTRTKGFVVGCDDFMAKPFAAPELVARVRRLLRRSYGL